jgi:hypothetical protein
MEYSNNMKRFLSIVLSSMIFASPTLAQTTTQGGGPDLPTQSGKGPGTLKDTTVHTTLDNGVVISRSKGSDGKPNGGPGGGDTNGGTAGGGAGDSKEGE